MIYHDKKNGFTLIELLVVVAIIGLLASLITLTLGTSRLRSRDARRLSDMQQVRSGLELYLSSAAGYPDTSEWIVGSELSCGPAQILNIPKDPAPALSYSYTPEGTSGVSTICGTNKTVWSSYQIGFTTEYDSDIGPAGDYCLRPAEGITPGGCP